MGVDYVDYVLDEVPPVDVTDWAALGELLEQSQAAHTGRLEQELAQINQELAARDRIHRELVGELEGKIDRYTDRLAHLYTIRKGRTDGTRDQLKDRITAFYRELRAEHRGHWQDRQDLEQERRAVRRELAEVEDDSLAGLL